MTPIDVPGDADMGRARKIVPDITASTPSTLAISLGVCSAAFSGVIPARPRSALVRSTSRNVT